MIAPVGTIAPVGKAWYLYPRIDAYGTPDPYGGFPKPDSNVQCPDGTPITALLSGTVTGINAPDGSIPAWGASVTIRLDSPINSIATHSAYLHLETLGGLVSIGQHVNQGDVIGYSGGNLAQGTQKVPVGFALFNGDVYGYGPTWQLYLGNPALNPVPLLSAAAGAGNTGSPLGNLPSSLNTVVAAISPNVSVAQLFASWDVGLALTNPFNVQATQDTVSAGPVNFSFTDPVSWIGDVATNLFYDTEALLIRSIFILLGLFILFKVSSSFIDYDALASTAMNIGKLAAVAA